MQIMPDQVVRSKQKIVLLQNRHLIFGFFCVLCDLAYQRKKIQMGWRRCRKSKKKRGMKMKEST